MLNQFPERNRNALEQALIEALHDEYKARATYRLIIQTFGPIRPFVNILQSEERHIQALTRLFETYAIALPIDDWDARVTVPDSVQEACQQGVEAEIENAALYHRLLNATQGYDDVQAVFLNLQRASQENHLPAFQRCVQRRSAEPLSVPSSAVTGRGRVGRCGGSGGGHRRRFGARAAGHGGH